MLRVALIFAILSAPVDASAQQHWFSVNLNCKYNNTTATCAISNAGNTPMFCRARADGELATGHIIYAYFNDWVPPGQYRYIYVKSPHSLSPFVRAFGGGQCHF